MSAMEHDLLAAFPDKPPRMQQRIAGVIDLLSEDARMPVTSIAEELDLPITTAYDYVMLVLSRLEMRTVFTPLPAKIPETPVPRFRCPQCKSDNTQPDRLRNEATGRTKITGACCKNCGYSIRRGQLSPTLLRRMEG